MAAPRIIDAKKRLDRLIEEATPHLFEPIAVAEVLYRNRVESLDLSEVDRYDRKSFDWCKAVVRAVYGPNIGPDSWQWGQLFDPRLISPAALEVLGRENRRCAVVETYIYGHVCERVRSFEGILRDACISDPFRFDIASLFRGIEMAPRFARSVGKAYETAVYALVEVIGGLVGARAAENMKRELLIHDFADFAEAVLGIPVTEGRMTNLAQIDVKYISLNVHLARFPDAEILSNEFFVVCRKAEASAIEALMQQLGFSDRMRGVICEADLVKWYSAACGPKYRRRICGDLLGAVRKWIRLEFPVAQVGAVNAFSESRGYRLDRLTGNWKVRVGSPSESGKSKGNNGQVQGDL